MKSLFNQIAEIAQPINTIYVLTQDGNEIYKGSQDGCLYTLQAKQHQSADYAQKFGGWKITPKQVTTLEAIEIAEKDPFRMVEVELLQDFKSPYNHNIKVKVLSTGKEATANTKAMTYTTTTKGSICKVQRNYLTNQ